MAPSSPGQTIGDNIVPGTASLCRRMFQFYRQGAFPVQRRPPENDGLRPGFKNMSLCCGPQPAVCDKSYLKSGVGVVVGIALINIAWQIVAVCKKS